MADELTAAQAAQAAPYIDIRLQADALLARLKVAGEIIGAEIVAALEEIGSAFDRIGADEAPEGVLGGSGGLRGSVYHELRGTPARELVSGWAAPHAEYASRGRRPGKMPPEAPILLWVRKVLDVPEDRAHEVAFLIRRAIGVRGTRGHPFVQRTLQRLDPVAQAVLVTAADRAAARIEAGR